MSILGITDDYDSLLTGKSVPVITSKGKMFRNAPFYIKNKLLYNYEKVFDDQGNPVLTSSGRQRRVKVLSAFGKAYKERHLEELIDQRAASYKQFLINPQLYEGFASQISDATVTDWQNEFYKNIGFCEEKEIPVYDYYGEKILKYKKERTLTSFTEDQLDSRLRELAIYELFYKDRYFQTEYYLNNQKVSRELPDYREMFLSS